MYFYGEPDEEGGVSLNGWPAFSTMLFWFIMTVGLEQLNGATIGNRLQNLRPVPKAGPWAKLTFGQSFKRHILDPFDLWPFGILGIILIKNTVNNQRLGDLWAKTIVLDENDPEQGFKYNKLMPTIRTQN